ncbi:coiled-coil domain-containing protein 115 [Lampris incognitus]|uniref:coiled-coil domain-containing protein 115 n=1 Tax=Lampris incognitus TaxID=2546036 RepID=UPI0024B54B77|nr:coiled-coil domain-containing protein 115 [Lampris incognitus]
MVLSERDEASLLMDEKLLRFMEQLELLEEKRASLNSLIEQGWFSMSKARYSMGNKQVSALQYASEMKPRVCVHARPLDSGEVEFCTEQTTQKSSAENRKEVETIGPEDSGVRRRVKSTKDTTEKEANTETSSMKMEPTEAPPVIESDQTPQQDPLKWFGILVPQSLKQAQSSFKQVIDLSVEVATLQSAVLKTRQELSLKVTDDLEEQKTCTD